MSDVVLQTFITVPPMQRALDLAAQALWLTSPNPRVGCVITSPRGDVLGEGHTQKAGGPHAEIVALQHAQARGHSVRGATAHVTLEPCSHHGRTGPCCDAMVQAGIAKVVVAAEDPNPLVAVGLKDITAHVNFTGVALAGQNAGLQVLGYTSQARFLLNLDVAERMAQASLSERVHALKLLNEHEMGELFKVVGFATHVGWQALGFAVGDRSHRL